MPLQKNSTKKATLEEVLTEAGWISEWQEQARVEGRTEGYEALLQTARNALAEGFPVHTVQKITGLPLETIQELQAK